MNFTLPTIYPLTDTDLSQLSHPEQTKRLIAGGATFIQLREKTAAPDVFFAAAKETIAIARPAGAKIIINDRVDIALAVKADGVHLGQDDLPPAEARKLLGNNAIIGISTHNIEQVNEALRQPVDYIAFGPIFPTATKIDSDPVVGLNKLTEIKRLTGGIQLVAIGGINADNYRDVLTAGADSVAMIGAIVSRPDLITERISLLLSNR